MSSLVPKCPVVAFQQAKIKALHENCSFWPIKFATRGNGGCFESIPAGRDFIRFCLPQLVPSRTTFPLACFRQGTPIDVPSNTVPSNTAPSNPALEAVEYTELAQRWLSLTTMVRHILGPRILSGLGHAESPLSV
jgi:hypothetical protein